MCATHCRYASSCAHRCCSVLPTHSPCRRWRACGRRRWATPPSSSTTCCPARRRCPAARRRCAAEGLLLLRTLVVHSRRDTERFLAAVRALVYSVCCHPVALHCMNWHASLCFVSHCTLCTRRSGRRRMRSPTCSPPTSPRCVQHRARAGLDKNMGRLLHCCVQRTRSGSGRLPCPCTPHFKRFRPAHQLLPARRRLRGRSRTRCSASWAWPTPRRRACAASCRRCVEMHM